MAGETEVTESLLTTMWNQMDLSWISLIKIGVIIVLCWLLMGGVRSLRGRVLKRLKEAEKAARINRNTSGFLRTLIPVGATILKGAILFFGFLMCLSALHISVSPFMYVLGFAGMGISLGAQDTFADIIRGILTLIEGQISVGDLLTINGSTGYAKELGIRKLVLIHFDGSVETFPYSKIETIQNFSVGPTTMEAEFLLASTSSVDTFEKIVLDVFKRLQEEPEWKSFFIKETQKAPSIEYERIAHSGLSVKVSLTTKSDPDGDFANVFKRKTIPLLQEAGLLNPHRPLPSKEG